MGLLDLFKRKKQLHFHISKLKNVCKNKDGLYVGQICKIIPDITKNDNETYYLETYEGTKIGIFKNIDFQYCEEYKYAIIYSISEKKIIVYILCEDVYPMSLKANINTSIENGDVVKIDKVGNLYFMQNKKYIGKIIDDRFNSININNIALSQIDNERILTMIYK